MTEWFESLTHLQLVFFCFAAVGGLLFFIQLVLILIGGGDGDTDVDTGDIGTDTDVNPDVQGSHPHADTDTSFKLLSFQGLTAFFMMFGLVGLAMNRGSEQGAGLSFGVAVAIGFACMWLVAKLFQLFRGLQSSGTIDLQNAVGQTGRVYLTIKAETPGQIEVPIQGHMKIYDAVSEAGVPLPTDTRVEVTAVRGSTMVVKKI